MAEFITAAQAVELIPDNSTVWVEGFIGSGVAEEIVLEIEKKFEENHKPQDLTICMASGVGDGDSRGLNHFAHEGLIKRVVAGHWGLFPKIHPLVNANKVEGYNFPQGVLSQMIRDAAAHRPATITKVGMGTFVDPELQGGKLNEACSEDIVSRIEVFGEDYLAYKTIYADVALIKGTYADSNGNISFDDEPLTLGAKALAMAVHNNGGIVIAQVKRKVTNHSIDPKLVIVPGVFVDYVVESTNEDTHMQTFATKFNPSFVKSNVVVESLEQEFPLDQRKIIARRSALFLKKKHHIVNYGIGIPEAISSVLKEENQEEGFLPTVEPGLFGGTPQGGFDFGASIAPQSIMDQPYMFDFYDGGGIDIAFLGLAECGQAGDINVSKFGPKIAGCGGFINITQSTNEVIFCGTFTAGGLKLKVEDGKLEIVQEGRNKKFVKEVEHVTFSGEVANKKGLSIFYVTERCVFELRSEGLTLIEIAPGMDLEKDILAHMDFEPLVAEDLKEMDARIFQEVPMGLEID